MLARAQAKKGGEPMAAGRDRQFGEKQRVRDPDESDAVSEPRRRGGGRREQKVAERQAHGPFYSP